MSGRLSSSRATPPGAAQPSAARQRKDDLRPIIPVGWRWLVGIYLGVPLLLVLLRPEIWPDNATDMIRHYLTTVVATVGIGGLIHALYAWPMPRLLARLRARPARLALHAAVIVTGVSLSKEAVRPLLQLLCGPELHRKFDDPLRELLIAVTAAMTVVAIATYYKQMRDRARRVEQLEAEARQAALGARLEALRARTNPHFLFNSLNTVASLIATDPTCAEETVVRLSDLFRYTLQSARRPRVKLADELAVVRDYLDIERLRLGERLRYRLDVDDALGGLRVPPLILQPLVENAVLHGVGTRPAGGEVVVSVELDRDRSRDGGDVVLRVHDHGDEPSARAHVGSGTALADLERRIELAFGAAASLQRERTERGYTVTLRLPYEALDPQRAGGRAGVSAAVEAAVEADADRAAVQLGGAAGEGASAPAQGRA